MEVYFDDQIQNILRSLRMIRNIFTFTTEISLYLTVKKYSVEEITSCENEGIRMFLNVFKVM